MAELDEPRVQDLLQQLITRDPTDPKIEAYLALLDYQKGQHPNKFGTKIYMPLESILEQTKQSYEVDAWSFGVILL